MRSPIRSSLLVLALLAVRSCCLAGCGGGGGRRIRRRCCKETFSGGARRSRAASLDLTLTVDRGRRASNVKGRYQHRASAGPFQSQGNGQMPKFDSRPEDRRAGPELHRRRRLDRRRGLTSSSRARPTRCPPRCSTSSSRATSGPRPEGTKSRPPRSVAGGRIRASGSRTHRAGRRRRRRRTTRSTSAPASTCPSCSTDVSRMRQKAGALGARRTSGSRPR